MIKRAIFLLITTAAVFFTPLPATLALILVGLLWFPFYLEMIVPLLILDFLYNLPPAGLFTWQFFFAIVGLLIMAVIEYWRGRLLMYN